MIEDFAYGLFIIVNSIISLYIVIYALIFLRRTKSYTDRRPWDFLVAGAILFLLAQLVSLCTIFTGEYMFDIHLKLVRIILEFAYGTLILTAFITQSQLILLSDMILITKKVGKRKKQEGHSSPHKDLLLKNRDKVHELSKKLTKDKEIKFEFDEDKLKEEMEKENFKSEIESEEELVNEDMKKKS